MLIEGSFIYSSYEIRIEAEDYFLPGFIAFTWENCIIQVVLRCFQFLCLRRIGLIWALFGLGASLQYQDCP